MLIYIFVLYAPLPMALANFYIEVYFFIRPISAYFYCLFFICTPCHGNLPLAKYNKRNPNDSRSSFLPCYFPICDAMLAYLAVPTSDFPSFGGI